MSDIIKRKFKCTGCGEDRPCFLETNQESSEIAFYDAVEDLRCALAETNQISYNWQEMVANGANKSTDPALILPVVSNSVCDCKVKEPCTFTEHGKIVEKCINCGNPIANDC